MWLWAVVFHQPGRAGSHSLAFNAFQFGFDDFCPDLYLRGSSHSSVILGSPAAGSPAPQPAPNWGQTGTGSYQTA